jgi:hypothetical protein
MDPSSLAVMRRTGQSALVTNQLADGDHWEDPDWKRAHRAVEKLDEAELTEILDELPDFDLNVSGYRGWTLLAYAVDCEAVVHQESGRPGPAPATVSAVLLAHGADPLKLLPDGGSCIDLARY